jgi:hypothetical protein
MFKDALVQLALLSVSGVQTHFAIESVPETLRRGQLPALLILPIEVETSHRRPFPERGQAIETVPFPGGPRSASLIVTHLLLVSPRAAGVGLSTQIPALVDLIDAYFIALSADLTLNGRLLEPPQVRIEPGVFEYGGVSYTGCAFRHRWVVAL